ncbi:MAG: hypothetical protein AAGA97_00335 [Pseudomonadota bacterium]
MTNTSPSRGTLLAIGAAAHMNFLHRLVVDSTPAFDHLILLEADPAAEPLLTARFDNVLPFEVIAAALGKDDGKAELLTYNFPGLTSLYPASEALRTLFPGLRVTSRKSVRTLSATTLIAHLEAAPRPLSVVIDLPGSELDILQALADTGELENIELLRVRCATEPLFASDAAKSSITAWLKQHHLQLYGADEGDPDWPELRFRPDQSARALEQAQNEMEALRQQQADMEGQLQDMTEKLSQACAELKQTESIQADLSLALRLQALAQTDLEDLREKYRASQAIRAQQEDLLQQLTPRLQQAAQQLRILAPETTEAEIDQLTTTPSFKHRAATGDKTRKHNR